MPVQYSGVLDEHHTVRQRVGLFDVSHMGEIEIRGPEALALVQHVATNNAANLKIGRRSIRPALRSRRIRGRHPGSQGGGRSLLHLRECFQPG